MGLIELLKAAIYGVVEGITEWLPISSTGHMLLLEQFMPLGVSKDFWDMFLVVIQLGAIIAVLISFFHELNPFSRSKSAGERRSTWTLWGKTIVACIPAAVVGLPLDDWIEDHLGGPFVIAAALIVYGIVFIVIESIRERRAQRLAAAFSATRPAASYRPRHFSSSLLQPQQGLTASQVADAEARIQDIDDLDWKTALGIGLFQVLSIVPGTSRSGSTIIGGLILGCSRTVAAQFTFYLAIPVMVGASGLRLVKYFLKGNVFTVSETAILLTGCVVAALVSLAAIRFLMSFVKKHDFKPFGWYRIALGVAVIAYFALVAA
ncbi:MAG: undecaprenyl-diphosphate phosphatase [Olsenella sp.]|nr:undecaprenyl-diphosphate phosphatase [Olsenella sp.]MCI1646681.1 undecaprenyl-diphosphate phosphatase [Olsenella sp.]MCI1667769.1 undecaprenyl-diphosphate phosphatase [Olsenella sp.]MCI1794201.1 undecaprenyl-diphosphate phosphatase [Olsenella sp.]MCI1810792.1 undecaprenyl-diphosphate phosphatase [Olsenella sp.]